MGKNRAPARTVCGGCAKGDCAGGGCPQDDPAPCCIGVTRKGARVERRGERSIGETRRGAQMESGATGMWPQVTDGMGKAA